MYSRNGIAYAIKRKTLLTDKLLMGKNSGALICKGDSISIDTELDLELANYFLEKVQRHADIK
jgi:CMP-N-acetylneuraminic acid synthetase